MSRGRRRLRCRFLLRDELRSRMTGRARLGLGWTENPEDSQGRPQAARRGSLDGPVSCRSHNRMRSPVGASCSPPAWCRCEGTLWVHLQSQSVLAGKPGNPGAVHLFVERGDMEWFGRNPLGSISGTTSPQCGGHEIHRARKGLRPARVSPRLGQATDLPVAQAVVDEREKFAGGRHPSDLLSPTLTHLMVVAADRGGAPLAGDRLDGGPADEP